MGNDMVVHSLVLSLVVMEYDDHGSILEKSWWVVKKMRKTTKRRLISSECTFRWLMLDIII